MAFFDKAILHSQSCLFSLHVIDYSGFLFWDCSLFQKPICHSMSGTYVTCFFTILIFNKLNQILIHHNYEYRNFYDCRSSVNFISTNFNLNFLLDVNISFIKLNYEIFKRYVALLPWKKYSIALSKFYLNYKWSYFLLSNMTIKKLQNSNPSNFCSPWKCEEHRNLGSI